AGHRPPGPYRPAAGARLRRRAVRPAPAPLVRRRRAARPGPPGGRRYGPPRPGTPLPGGRPVTRTTIDIPVRYRTASAHANPRPAGTAAGRTEEAATTTDDRDPSELETPPPTPAAPHRHLGSGSLLVEPIGHGASGRVWRGVRRADGATVAIKVLREEFAR